MIKKEFTHSVRDAQWDVVFFRGTYEECRLWIGQQPDWENFNLVSEETGRSVKFVISR